MAHADIQLCHEVLAGTDHEMRKSSGGEVAEGGSKVVGGGVDKEGKELDGM